MDIGDRFGSLTVTGFVGNRKGHAMWACRCDCGRDYTTQKGHLVRGAVQSCGCKRGALISAKSIAHGHSKRSGQTIEYSSWLAMRQRCLNPNNPKYHRYGGRGVTICERWNDYAAFYADMGPRPSLKHSIDRINNDGNYERGNCRWATSKTQANNSSRTKALTWNGATYTLTELAERAGIKMATLSARLIRGWPIERAVQAVTR